MTKFVKIARKSFLKTEVVLLLLLVVGFFCIFPPSLNYGDHSSWGIVFQENLINYIKVKKNFEGDFFDYYKSRYKVFHWDKIGLPDAFSTYGLDPSAECSMPLNQTHFVVFILSGLAQLGIHFFSGGILNVEQSLMVFGLLIFILTYFYAYKLGNLLGGKFFGLALALVITSNVYFNQLTRSMIFPFITLYPLLFLSSFYYLLSSHRVKNNSKLFSLIGLSVSLAFCFLNGYSNTNAILLGLLGGFFLFLIFYLKILNRKDYQFLGWNHYGFIISFAVFWVFLLSSLWSNFLGQHNFYGIDAILHDRVWGIIIGRARVSALMSKFELSSIWNAVQNIIYALYFPNRRTAGVGGIHEASFLQEISFLNPIEGVFFILGVFFVFKNLFSKSLINCFLAFLIPFFLYRAVTSGEGAIVIGRYNYDFYFVTLFFVSYGLIQVIKTKKKLILILLFILIFNIKTFNSKFIWDSNERLFQSFGVYQLRNLYREEISKENNLIIYDYSVFPHGYLYHIDLWSLLEKKVDYDVFGKFFTGEMANSLETFEKFIKTMPHKHLYLIIPTATKYNFSFNPKLVQAPSYLGTFSPYKIIVNRQGQPTFWVYKFPKKP